ncbi:SMI1/KNR4 family protein [Pseudomonas coronafaciens]|uniref:SMI1/KNR4 family protein n=1 Tax=Pseudomonas coronafaciens TaxID=53409 RepID=UPI000EFF33DB|nr:SMI1/KNR4 family protein [Pseudomonas coronafaciens]
MPIIYKKGLQKTDLDRIESSLNRVLPSDYKTFLNKMNGFYLTAPDYVQIPLTAVDDGAVSFDRLFGLIPLEECNDIVEFNSEFSSELDFLSGAIIIGEDGGGNPYVMIGESKASREGIYYWDRTHLHESDMKNNCDIVEVNDCGNLFFIASSFDEFYNLILKCIGGSPEFIEET